MPNTLKAFVFRALVGTLILAGILNVAATALQLLNGRGIETFLGWTGPEILAAVLGYWNETYILRAWPIDITLGHAAMAYLAVDSVLFIPAYTALLLGLAIWLRREFETDRARSRGWAHFGAIGIPLLALIVVDNVENIGGFIRLYAPIGAVLFAVTGLGTLISALGVWRKLLQEPELAALRSWPVRLGAGATIVIILAVLLIGPRLMELPPSTGYGLVLTAWAHAAKNALVEVLAVVVLVLMGTWYFGFHIDISAPGGSARAADRVVLRVGVLRIVARSRYVLTALVFFGFLLLDADQIRDVVVGIPAAILSPDTLYGGIVVFLASALALAGFVFSCWMWTRLAVSIRAHNWDQLQTAPLEEFAKGWARLLGLAPLVLMGGLIASCFHDAILASSAVPDSCLHDVATTAHPANDPQCPPGYFGYVPAALLLFGAIAIGCAVWFLIGRARMAKQAGPGGPHYVSAPNMTQFSGDIRTNTLHDRKYRFMGLPMTPLVLPLAAVFLMMLLRTFSSTGVLAGSPATFAVLVLALTWWLGVFGWLSLSEIVSERPWVFFLILAAGILGLLGLTDNHAVPVLVESQATHDHARGMLVAVWLLALVAAVTLVLLVRTDVKTTSMEMPTEVNAKTLLSTLKTLLTERFPHATIVVIALSLCYAIARIFDPAAHPGTSDSSAARPTLDAAMASWAQGLAQKPGRVYFVAAEGGGIRAAYWTAMQLVKLHKKDPTFDERTFALSGVSGGSLGEAVYAACLKGSSSPPKKEASTPQSRSADDALTDCVDQFGKTDLLTPLVGPLVFEDLLARVIPTSGALGCTQAGCGFLSRGLWFEHQLSQVAGASALAGSFTAMRATPAADTTPSATAAASAAARATAGAGGTVGAAATSEVAATATQASAGSPWHPHLMLNSTWVETGERTIASTVDLGQDFPGARDQLQKLGNMDISGATAAHNSARFPYANGLGGVRCQAEVCPIRDQKDVSKWGIVGHLADGGFFDNSGTQTVIDLLLHFAVQGGHAGLQPVVILIRNNQPLVETPDTQANPTIPNTVPGRATMDPCSEDTSGLGQEQPAKALHLYTDGLGPAVAIFNTSGIGSGGRRGPALLGPLMQSNSLLRASVTQVVTRNQYNRGALVPLGWYLSPLAQFAMSKENAECPKTVAGTSPALK